MLLNDRSSLQGSALLALVDLLESERGSFLEAALEFGSKGGGSVLGDLYFEGDGCLGLHGNNNYNSWPDLNYYTKFKHPGHKSTSFGGPRNIFSRKKHLLRCV